MADIKYLTDNQTRNGMKVNVYTFDDQFIGRGTVVDRYESFGFSNATVEGEDGTIHRIYWMEKSKKIERIEE